MQSDQFISFGSKWFLRRFIQSVESIKEFGSIPELNFNEVYEAAKLQVL